MGWETYDFAWHFALSFYMSLRFYLRQSAKSASLSLSKANDTNKTILPIDIFPRGNSPVAIHKIPFGTDFWVPTLGIL